MFITGYFAGKGYLHLQIESTERAYDIGMDRRKIPQNPSLSYFVRIVIPQALIKIKVPKLLAQAMQKRFGHGCKTKNGIVEDNEQHSLSKKKMRNKPRDHLPRKIGSVFANAFGKMMIESPEERSRSKGRNYMKIKPFSHYIKGGDTKRVDAGFGKMLTWRRKSKTAGSPRKTSREIDKDDSKDGEERGGDELCKKRILMGGKCKPLNLSGTLQYDENGILLSEMIMP